MCVEYDVENDACLLCDDTAEKSGTGCTTVLKIANCKTYLTDSVCFQCNKDHYLNGASTECIEIDNTTTIDGCL